MQWCYHIDYVRHLAPINYPTIQNITHKKLTSTNYASHFITFCFSNVLSKKEREKHRELCVVYSLLLIKTFDKNVTNEKCKNQTYLRHCISCSVTCSDRNWFVTSADDQFLQEFKKSIKLYSRHKQIAAPSSHL